MKVLVIGDSHLPAVHPGYLAFCRDLEAQHKCDTVIHIGDFLDYTAISFHAKNPEMPGPEDEAELAYDAMRPWVRAFPKLTVTWGNHDLRVLRLAADAGIPKRFIREFADAWDTPGWTWLNDIVVDDVFYTHGTGCGGEHPAFNLMKKALMSCCIGHVHHAAGIKWRANPTRRIFGMDVGTGVDDRAMAFAYAKDNPIRSMLSAGVVLDGVPQHFIMPIGPGEKYNRRRFEKRRALK